MYYVGDEQLARVLQHEMDSFKILEAERELRGKEEKVNPVDPNLEFLDPTPSIHDLFVRFDDKFFWSSLGMVEVTWSQKMTTCAGTCYFEKSKGHCRIALSAPLLTLRPRKDLVETLLHEMIHAYLFVTNNYFDREDHGPEFHKHMFRINKQAGTNITVYHTFHDEVKYYQRHIWRCNGPCQYKKPYFGICQRAMNRPPGPYDSWWARHKMECNGTFIKIAEPEDKRKVKTKTIISSKPIKDLRDFFSPVKTRSPNKSLTGGGKIITINDLKSSVTVAKVTTQGEVKTKENTVSKVKTLIGGTKGSENRVKMGNVGNAGKTETSGKSILSGNSSRWKSIEKSPLKGIEKYFKNTNNRSGGICEVRESQNVENMSKDLGKQSPDIKISQERDFEKTREVVRNFWTKKYPVKAEVKEEPSSKKAKIQCPICEEDFSDKEVENHVDICLYQKFENVQNHSKAAKEVECPVCNRKVPPSEINSHLEGCLNCNFEDEEVLEEKVDGEEVVCQSVPCPCCFQWFLESEMDAHIDECLTMIALKEEFLN